VKGKPVKHLATFIILSFTVALHPSFSSRRASPVFRDQFLLRLAQHTDSAHKSVLEGASRPCIPLKAEKPEKAILLPHRATCFTVKVNSGEASQLQLDQPEDLKIQLLGSPIERSVDSFDIGIETLTIAVPGTYRVEVRSVKPLQRPLALSIVQWKFDLEKSSAWEQAETWATISKKSREIEDVDKSLTLWLGLGDTSSIARAYLKRGGTINKKEPANARVAFEKALELCRANFDTRCSAEAENNSGQMSSRLGDFNDAQRRLEEAAQDWRNLTDKENEGATLSNLGLMQLQAGNFGQAIAYLNEAKGLLQKRNPVRYAQTLNNLGLCYQSLSEYGRARDYFAGALAGFIRGRSLSNLVLARMNLGRNYMLEDNLEHAQQILELAAAEAEKLPELQPRADTLRNLAQNLYQQERFDEAQSRLDLALDADRVTGNRRGQSSALHYLGLIAEKRGDITTARSLLAEAAELRRRVGLRNDAADSLFELASLEYHATHLDAARDYAEQALTLLESVRSQTPSPTLRAFYYSRKQKLFELLVEIAMTADNPDAARDGFLASDGWDSSRIGNSHGQ
jgi:tetratricopeptide (TPR) repeat protein